MVFITDSKPIFTGTLSPTHVEDTAQQCEPVARDGRQWKKRRAGKLDAMIVQVVRTKKDKPTPADVIKTAASLDGEVITYMPANCALNNQSHAQFRQSSKNFELLPGYLEAMKQLNPNSVIGYSHDSERSIKHVHFFPRFMNTALKFERPVISLDVAYLKCSYKGTMYVASVLSGTRNEVYSIRFMISSGNEDGETWTTVSKYLKEACPIIFEQGFGNERGDDGEISASVSICFRPRQGSESGPTKCVSKKQGNELCKTY